jgi:Xaa-Pro aminopeptidase
MALSYEFLIERAEQAATEAASALLDNVRDRALRSEKAWRAMAEQLREVTNNREIARLERLAELPQPGA